MATVTDMTIDGLPLHPLVVHAVVVLLPLAVVSGWLWALAPGARWLLRWVTLAASVAGFAMMYVARLSGDDLDRSGSLRGAPSADIERLVHEHEQYADLLLWLMIAFMLVVVVAFLVWPAVSGLASGRFAHEGRSGGGRPAAVLRWLMPALLIAFGLAVLVAVFLTGEAGARAVWSR